MVTYKQASTNTELRQILDLQERNLPKILTVEEMEVEGFLTVEHDFSLLKQMNDTCQHTIAKYENRVIGYALSMHPRFGKKMPVLQPMLAEINTITSEDASYIIMGQICVAKSHRGQGVFRMLYQKMKAFVSPTYTKIITEVDVKNTRSLNAHKAVGFKELKRYASSNGKCWSLIVLE